MKQHGRDNKGTKMRHMIDIGAQNLDIDNYVLFMMDSETLLVFIL